MPNGSSVPNDHPKGVWEFEFPAAEGLDGQLFWSASTSELSRPKAAELLALRKSQRWLVQPRDVVNPHPASNRQISHDN